VKLKVAKSEFVRFLDGLSKISDTAILKTTSEDIYAIAASDDRSMFLWSSLRHEFEEETVLNIPSLRKLSKAVGISTSEYVDLELKSNCLLYKGGNTKFKYHLYDDGVLPVAKLSLNKIESLSHDWEFVVSKEFIGEIVRSSTIFNGTNKLYITTDDGHLMWSLEDKTMTNTDIMTIQGDPVDFELPEPFILSLDNLKLMSKAGELLFKLNKNGIGFVEIESDNVRMKYVLSSLTK